MRRNRRTKQKSQFAVRSVQTAVLIVLAFTMLMTYWSVDSRCGALSQKISEAERALKSLDGELQRETARWDETRTPESIDRQLVYFGAEMQLPQPEQIVRMDRSGRPVPGQISVNRAIARANAGRAKVATVASVASVSGAARVASAVKVANRPAKAAPGKPAKRRR